MLRPEGGGLVVVCAPVNTPGITHQEVTMHTSRVQLALNVTDIDAATDFYRRLFGVEPAKQRPGSANTAARNRSIA